MGEYMEVRLTVIGSSPAWPNPGSAQSGYLLEGAGCLLLDCGPGVLGRLRETGRLAAVGAIAITHFHLDHWGDLVPWAWLAAYGSDPPPRAEVWLPPGGADELATFASRWGNDGMFERAFDLREFEPRTPFAAAGFTIEARTVPHYTLAAVGFRVSHDGRTFVYSGDSGPGSELSELADGADLFLCEATLARGADEAEPRGHLAADEAVAAASGPVLLTHRPVELPPPDGAPLARDGLSVEI
jgi:ribonuclease BN (tRNA processing enzyme)